MEASSSDDQQPEAKKIVVVGDGTVGKTCLLITYTTNEFPTRYVPTIFDSYSFKTTAGERSVLVNLWDTAGQEEYDRLRVMSYPQPDVFILCFSVVCPKSFSNVRSKWLPEVRHHCPTACVLLVGTKRDLREDLQTLQCLEREGEVAVRRADAERLAKEMGAVGYIECSSMRRVNLAEVFEVAIKACLRQKKARKKRCVFV